MPAYAAWFRHDRLHQLEVKGLPEYFQSNLPTKNPRVGSPQPHLFFQTHALHTCLPCLLQLQGCD